MNYNRVVVKMLIEMKQEIKSLEKRMEDLRVSL
jgi:hypothetical protein